MNNMRKIALAKSMLICHQTLQGLVKQLQMIEENKKISTEDKLSKLKIIKEEITKVNVEIDSIKKEINLLDSYSIN